MKLIALFIIYISLIPIQLRAQNYDFGNADSALFTKYKVPDTDLHLLRFNANANYNYSNELYYRSYYNWNIRPTKIINEINSSLSSDYFLLKESDRGKLSFNLDLTGTYVNSNHIVQGPFDLAPRINNVTANFNFALAVNSNNYIKSSNIFYSLGTNIDINVSHLKNLPFAVEYDNDYLSVQNYIISAGIGWGRIRNITPVISAIKLQEKLKLVSSINDNLKEKTINGLAQKFSEVQQYIDDNGKPDNLFWKEFENIISDDGINPIKQNQFIESYLQHAQNDIRFMRNEGFETSLNLQMNYHNRNEWSYYITKQLYTLLNGRLDFSHQLNLKSQINFTMGLSGGTNILTDSEYKQYYDFSAGLGYDYELTEKLLIIVQNKFYVNFQNTYVQTKFLFNDIGLNLYYFIFNNMSIRVSYTWDYNVNKFINRDEDYINNHHNINIGLTYYIDRGMIF
jgi:hypothetical protein